MCKTSTAALLAMLITSVGCATSATDRLRLPRLHGIMARLQLQGYETSRLVRTVHLPAQEQGR